MEEVCEHSGTRPRPGEPHQAPAEEARREAMGAGRVMVQGAGRSGGPSGAHSYDVEQRTTGETVSQHGHHLGPVAAADPRRNQIRTHRARAQGCLGCGKGKPPLPLSEKVKRHHCF